MPRLHGPRRAQIAFSDAAAKQLETISSEAELHAFDRALVVISDDPDIGGAVPGDPTDTTGPRLRQYTDELGSVRIQYFVTALPTVVVVTYIEV